MEKKPGEMIDALRQAYLEELHNISFDTRYLSVCSTFTNRGKPPNYFTPKRDRAKELIKKFGYSAKFVKAGIGFYDVDNWHGKENLEIHCSIELDVGVCRFRCGSKYGEQPVGFGFAQEYRNLPSEKKKREYLQSIGESYDYIFPLFANEQEIEGILKELFPMYEEFKASLIVRYEALGF